MRQVSVLRLIQCPLAVMAMAVRRKKGIHLKGSQVHWHERKAGNEDMRTYKYTEGKADMRGAPGVNGADGQ